MASLTPFTTDAIPPEENIVSDDFFREITVFEVNGGATSSFYVREPADGASQVLIGAGQQYTFKAQQGQWYRPGQVVGTVAAFSGSLNMAKVSA